MRLSLVVSIIVCAAGARAEVPLPPPRPPDIRAPEAPLPVPRPETVGPPASSLATVPAGREEFGPPWPREVFGPPIPSRPASVPLLPDVSCPWVLAGGKLVAVALPPIVEPEGCGVEAPIRLEAVLLPSGHRIAIEPPAVVRCDVAERLADWLRDDIATIPLPYGDLAGVADASGYACRGRNHRIGARLSEHARGNALDILAFRYPAHVIGLKDATARAFLAQVSRTACLRFSTVLGPGSDGYHEDNLHLDLQFRKNGSHYCHWEPT